MSEPRRLNEFLKWQPPHLTSYLDRGLMYKKTKVLVYGKYKSMKSMLVQSLGISLAKGEPWLGIRTNPTGVKVFYLQLEIPEPLLHRRVTKMLGNDVETKQDIVFWTEHVLKVDTKEGMARLRSKLDIYKPDVLIIDPLYKILSVNMSDNFALNHIMDELDQLINDYELTIVLVTHSRKPGANEDQNAWGSDNMLGGVLLSAWPDTIMEVNRDKDGLRIDLDVVRHAEEELEPIHLKVDKDLHFIVQSIKM